jgi:basic membrane lipoprotein Med (substrate-binding protein (PBP1-ABC) superfamily)
MMRVYGLLILLSLSVLFGCGQKQTTEEKAADKAVVGSQVQQIGDQRMNAINKKVEELKKTYPNKSQAELGAMATEMVDQQMMRGPR